MAQLGDLVRAKALLRRAAVGFGPQAAVARARCVVAEAEIALVSRDLGRPAKALAGARATLEAHGDRVNAAHARYLEARRLLLIGHLDEAERTLGKLDPAHLSKFDSENRLVSGGKPTKEAFLHFCMYKERADARAVVHLHSTHSVAVSLLADVDPRDALPPLTAYFVMRVGRLPLAPYFPPGDESLAKAVGALAGEHHAVLLANHGPVVAGTSLENAQYATEELEETARLFLMLRGQKIRPLTPTEVNDLRERYNLR